MSIFKESFKPGVRKQLETRQNAMLERSPKNLQWINSRNSWVRMSSSVNVDGTNDLAKQYILQGGLLSPSNTLRSGLGDFSKAYSNTAYDGTQYRLGIRPMPGINNVDVKNRGAYGSILCTTVHFQCWDIKQLEDIELLYMRPGYTVLVEWGWAPYLDESENLSSLIPVNNQLIDAQKGTKETLFESIKEQAQKNGNYEAVLGYIKNFSWSARSDGGYDCTTEVISLGEVLESLKVNYTPIENLSSIKDIGFLTDKIKGDIPSDISNYKDKLKETYAQNILAGIFYELYYICHAQGTTDSGRSFVLTDDKSTYDIFHKTIEMKSVSTDTSLDNEDQFYITLGSLCSLLNNYVLLRDKAADKPWVELSVLDPNQPGVSDSTTGYGYLLALANPLQLSIDPTICLIKNEKWGSGIKVVADGGNTKPGDPIIVFKHNLKSVPYANTPEEFVKTLIRNVVPSDSINNKLEVQKFIENYLRPNGDESHLQDNIKEVTRIYNELYKNYRIEPPTLSQSWGLQYDPNSLAGQRVGKTIREILPTTNTFYDFLEDQKGANLGTTNIDKILGGTDNRKNIADGDPAKKELDKLNEQINKASKTLDEAKTSLSFLSKIDKPYFVNDQTSSELGIIGNIYVNIQFLYELCLNKDLAAQDKKEKKDINLYDFMKNILSKISSAIGEVNNFELFVEPNGHHARIIDINYVDSTDRKDVFDNAFQLEVQNLKSTVRTYKLESKIFPEQSTQVAIAAQTGGGGGIGTDTTTMVGFNKKLTDRLIPEKDIPSSLSVDPRIKLDAILSSIDVLYEFFVQIKIGAISDSEFDVSKAGLYEGALRDLIANIINLTKSKSGNRAILPTVFSAELDGIGGIIIGNVFKIDPDFLPRGYKGENGVGSKLGYVVTSLGHKIGNGDWVTSIEGKTIILDDPEGPIFDYDNIIIHLGATTEETVLSTNIKDTTPPITNIPYTTDRIISTLDSKGYRYFKDPWMLNLVGIRSKVKQQGTVAVDKFIDYMVMWYYDSNGKRIDGKAIITTTPARSFYVGTADDKFNSVIPNQYRDTYQIGPHKGGYTALVEVKPILISRQEITGKYDFSKTSTASPGDNIHRASASGTSATISCNNGTKGWSAGCQVFSNVNDFNWMMAAAKQQVINTNRNVFDYTLIKEEEIK